MDRSSKITVITLSVATSIGVLGARWQSLLFLLIGCSLLVFALTTTQKVAVLATIPVASLLFPASRVGWVYGFDSNLEAVRVDQAIDAGLQSLGTNTVFLHAHAAILSQISELSNIPSTQGVLLTTWILPVVYIAAIISILVIITRQLYPQSYVIGMVPILLWIPFLQFQAGARRQSIALVLFVLFLYVSLRSQSFRMGSYSILKLILVPAIILSHHFTGAILLLFTAVFEWISGSKSRIPLVEGISFATVFILLSNGHVVYILLGMIPMSVAELMEMFTSSNPPVPFETNSLSIWTFVERSMSLWLYQLVLAVPLLVYIIDRWNHQKSIPSWSLIVVLWGGVIGSLSVLAYLTPLPIAVGRVMTFYVIIGGPAAIVSVQRLGFKHLSITNAGRTLVPLLLVLSLLMLPIYGISGVEPQHSENEIEQDFSPKLYASVSYLGKIPTEIKLIGDAKVSSVAGTQLDRSVYGRHQSILRASVPNESIVVLRDMNRHLYIAWSLEYGDNWLGVEPTKPNQRFSNNSNLLYDNGNISVYSG